MLVPAPLTPALFTSGERMPVLGEGRTHKAYLKPDPQIFCSRNLKPAPTPDWTMTATEQRRSPSSHLALAVTSSSQAPFPTKLRVASTPWGKMWLVFMSDPALPSKPQGTARLYRNTPTQEKSLQDCTESCSCNFIEIEKDEWNENQRNLFQLKEQGKPEKKMDKTEIIYQKKSLKY